jgi:hypothetical protein
MRRIGRSLGGRLSSLRIVEHSIGAITRDQLVMTTLLDNHATVQNHQPVGAAQRAQAMGNRNRGAPLDQVF